MDSLSAFRSTNVGQDVPEGFALSRTVGWTSVGLGVAELIAPRVVGSVMGLSRGTPTSLAVRAAGIGDLGIGLGVLFRPRRPGPLWVRVAGDALGIGLLAWSLRRKRTGRARGIATLIASAGVMALDAYTSRQVTRAHEAAATPVIFSVTINRPPSEVYAFFRKLENLPFFMDYLVSVEQVGARSHWIAQLPTGQVSWDADIVRDEPGERIVWETVDRSLFSHRGTVTFARTPGGTATEVRVQMEVGLPGIAPSATLARLLTKPQLKGDLRRLKQVMETGEVLFSDASSHRGPYPAQPSLEGTEAARARSAESRLTHPNAPTAAQPSAPTAPRTRNPGVRS